MAAAKGFLPPDPVEPDPLDQRKNMKQQLKEL